ncbi:MAG: UDP-3-O-[3-hydroxymyristoyl] glucosamine N-acyltransferase [Acidobacteria bacterium]|nr:UDP-3-O-[3-hydroxymyristoyl] glucosamine N-acyltransferase [Acidobacteriota bacterium]
MRGPRNPDKPAPARMRDWQDRMKLSEIAQKINCQMVADSDIDILGVAGIDDAASGDLTFVSNRKYVSRIKSTNASAIILAFDLPPVSIPSLRTDDPYMAFAKVVELFYTPPRPEPGIHPTAVIAEDAQLGSGASIGAFSVIGKGCVLGSNVVVHPGVVLYDNVTVGCDSMLHAQVVIREYCRIGSRVIIQNGAIIGSDGFGFAPAKDGSYYKIPQSGCVIIEDDVEIGANTTVDRAAVGNTIVQKGAKLDNLIQIGHGSEVGENCVLAAQVGLAGSTHLGKNIQVGGQAGFAGHTHVGDNAVITAQSGTSHDVEPGAVLSGSPAFSNMEWLRSMAAFPKLPNAMRRLRQLEKEIERLKEIIESGGGK